MSKQIAFYYQYYYSSLFSGLCGRYANKILCILLSFLILFSFSVSSSAAEFDGFYSRNMVHKAYIFQNVDNVLTPFDYTDHLTVSNGTYAGKNCTLYSLPSISTSNIRYVSSYQIEELNASHEYHIKFQSSSNVISETNMCLVSLVFYNGDEILKTQNLGGCNFPNDQWQEVEFDFVPDTSGLGGYKTRIEFQFISYSNTNSVTYRLSDFIEFEDKDDNAGWFQKIINAIKEIPEKIGDLRDNISNYFSALGDRITAKFESVGTSITNKFEEVKNAIGSWFTEIGDKLSNKFAEVGNAITSKFSEIGAEFSATFDKFKPRVYEVFDWTLGTLNSDGTIDNWNNEDLGHSITSSGFYIPNGSKYILDIEENDIFKSDYFDEFSIDVQYVENGNIFSYLGLSLRDFIEIYPDGYELISGKTYYFTISNYNWDSFESYFGSYDLDDLCNSVVKVYADEGWLTAFGRMILNGIKNLFIPSDNFLNEKKVEIQVFLEDHFGILYTAPNIIITILQKLLTISPEEPSLTMPAIEFMWQGEKMTLTEPITIYFNDYISKGAVLETFYNFYRAFSTVSLILMFVNYAKNKYDYYFGKDGEGIT